MKIFCSVSVALICSFCIDVTFLSFIEAHNRSGSTAKLQSQLKKVRQQTMKRDFKEKSRGHSRKFRDMNAIGEKSEEQDARPVPRYADRSVELYVRRENAGLWTYFSTVDLIDSHKAARTFKESEGVLIVDSIRAICEGGLQAETARIDVEQHIALLIFGAGMGQPLIYGEVIDALKQFRKVRPKQMQFGYRIFQQEGGDEYVTLLDRSMTKISHPPITSIADLPAAEPVDLQALMQQQQSSLLDSDESFNAITSVVRDFAADLASTGVKHMVVCADGSALFRGKTSIDARVGFYMAAYDSAGISSSSTSESSASDNSFNGISSSLSKSSDRLRNQHIEPVAVTVSNLGGCVTTPFDAELLAGVVGLFLMVHLQREQPELDINALFLTDSRSLLRTIRNVRSADSEDQSVENETVQEEVSSNNTNDESSRVGSSLSINRMEIVEVLRRVCNILESSFIDSPVRSSDHRANSEDSGTGVAHSEESCDSAADHNSSDNDDPSRTKLRLAARWTAAHPERKDVQVERYSI